MAKKNVYAVAKGRKTGLFYTWAECEQQVKGFSSHAYKGFATQKDAVDWLRGQGVDWNDENDKNTENGATNQDTQRADGNAIAENTAAMPVAQDKSANASMPKVTIDNPQPINPKVNDYCQNCQKHFSRLSDEQRRAVQAVEGNYLLFAVPGSGKTTVMIARAGYMVHACGIKPAEMVLLSFTKASAEEMSKRYQKYFPYDAEIPVFRTIHSFCYNAILPKLRDAGMCIPDKLTEDKIEDVIDGKKRKKSLKNVIFRELSKECKLPSDRRTREAVQTVLTGVKNSMMSIDKLQGRTMRLPGTGEMRDFPPIYQSYEELLQKYQCMDFDDMLIYALDGLKQYPHVLESLWRQYRYWSIDEAQDNSPLQQELLHLLAGGSNNLFMVGDDDQSIYAFRGAKPRGMLEFAQRSDVQVLTMGANYRSVDGIVKTAEAFIKENPSHQDKQMRAAKEGKCKIAVRYDLHTAQAQYETIIGEIHAASRADKDMAVLYRENISALPVMFYLRQQKMDFHTSASLNEILQYPTISKLLNALHFCAEPNSWKWYKKARFTLNISPSDDKTANLKEMWESRGKGNILELLRGAHPEKNYEKTSALVSKAKKSKPYDVLLTLLEDAYINTEQRSDRMQAAMLLSTAQLYDRTEEFFDAIAAMRKYLREEEEHEDDAEEELGEDQDSIEGACSAESECRVTLSTMHSAKGLEFDKVLLIDYLEPPAFTREPAELVFEDEEEARRLFYVAVTRAKSELLLFVVQSYHGNVEEANDFIREYAFICDGFDALSEEPVEEPPQNAAMPLRESSKYYGVREGFNTGVFTSWQECSEQVNGYSGSLCKSFATWEEAAHYAYPQGIPEEAYASRLDKSNFSEHIVMNMGQCCTWPHDLPPCVTEGILSLFAADRLTSLSRQEIRRIKAYQPDYNNEDEVCEYSGVRAKVYALLYLPVNFYKVFFPLWDLLRQNKLPLRAKILELGAGPGTATLATFFFYCRLAAGNPNVHFSLNYQVAERQEDFLRILSDLWQRMLTIKPKNLEAELHCKCGDAFEFLSGIAKPTYNLILESNMLNPSESKRDKSALYREYGNFLAKALLSGGKGILIEPGKELQKDYMYELLQVKETLHFFLRPTIMTVDASHNGLVKDMEAVGLRWKQKDGYWFSTCIVAR